MKNSKKRYELMLILQPNMTDTERKSFLTKLSSEIDNFDGKIEDTNLWGKRILAFPIMKNKEGYYLVLNILLDPKNSTELLNSLNIKSEILRFLSREVKVFKNLNIPNEKKSL